MILFNNWENIYFIFDEELLGKLMKEVKYLGVDMFLFDDGWFGNKYLCNDDYVGLGDWEVMKSKFFGGIFVLVEKVKEVGVKFGIWIELEMVNFKSDLFEIYLEWVIYYLNWEIYYFCNQLVFDLSNFKV